MGAMMPKLTVLTTAIAATFASLQVSKIVSGVVAGFRSIMIVLNSYQAAVAASQHVSILLASTMTPLQLAIGVLTGKVSLATAAQVAWNAVMNMNPVMLAITAVGLLSGAIAGLVLAYDGYLERNSEIVIATQNIANASQEAAQHTQELSNSLKSITDNAEENITNLEAEAYANGVLADELYNLAEKATLTANEKQRMQVIVGELNSAIPDLNLALNSETGQLNLTREAVQDLISQKLELAKANAMQQLYTEQLKAQYKAEADALSNAQRLAEAQAEYNRILGEGTEKGYAYGGQVYKHIEYTREQRLAMGNLKTAMGNYSTALQTSQTAVLNSQTAIQNLSTVTGVQLPASFTTAQQSSKGFFDALLQQTATASSQSESKGNDFGQGYVNGINAKKSEAYQAGYDLGLQALKGTQDAQRSQSPAKETIELGKYYGEGYLVGIEKLFKSAMRAGSELAEFGLKGTAEALGNAKEIISEKLKKIFEDTRSFVDREIAKSNKTLLEGEKKYAEASLEIERNRQKREWAGKVEAVEKEFQEQKAKAKNAAEIKKAEQSRQEKLDKLYADRRMELVRKVEDEYLADLKETAEKERAIFEARQKDIENLKKSIVETYTTLAEEAIDSIDDLAKAQGDLAGKLFNYGDLMYEVERKRGTKTVKVSKLSNLEEQTKKLETYEETLLKLRDKGVSEAFFDMVRGMGVDEGLDYATEILKLSEDKFEAYLASWDRKKAVSDRISKSLYKTDAERLEEEITGKFENVENEMQKVGKNSAEEFGVGFLSQLRFVISEIRHELHRAFGDLYVGGVETVVTGGIQTIGVPALAKGGIAPRKMLAMIGEKGREAVLPLENNTGWMDVLADKVSSRMGGGSSTVVLQVGEREFGRAVVEYGGKAKKITGTRLVSR
jgi:hypothetical protein